MRLRYREAYFREGADEITFTNFGENYPIHYGKYYLIPNIAEIEHYLNVHTGIRTRYLGLYCAWIAFRASVKGKDIAEKVDELVQKCYQTSAAFKSRTRY